jgi:hypothetical protein
MRFLKRKGRHHLPALSPSSRCTEASGNPIKVAQLDAGKEMAPLLNGALTERPFRAVRVAKEYNFTTPRNLYTLTIVAGARDAPIKINFSQLVWQHEELPFESEYSVTIDRLLTCEHNFFAFQS